SVESSRTSVDFPEPFWPRIAMHSPRSIEKDTSSSAGTRRRRRRRPDRSASRRKNSLRKLSTSTAYISGSYKTNGGHGKQAHPPATPRGARGQRRQPRSSIGGEATDRGGPATPAP